MANPSRIPDPRQNDPDNPSTPVGADPLSSDPRLNPANSQDPRVVDNRNVVQSRGAGSGVLIAAVVLVLAVIAYFVFAPGTDTAMTPGADTTTTEPATPAPEGTAPETPAPDAAAPAPDATAPADPATPAPDATAPAEPAPAPAEPAPAPAQ
ncbi:hypothetical protein [Allomesorhizobium alhagi]|jgi:hypothetical protein|uniref:Uncharacterized protein n=1 Tax=Mesorhizobium alhagi CCNWXJ12-2 TaxID=1107882 RepID=H0HL72_9HYPH|nr:hypothetical protein [Mesorhizobium alhagi]EHK58556.1 hypothetical protein MAXJ12_04414 [Mesorhizobium alhagi CCNWXJ12-2]